MKFQSLTTVSVITIFEHIGSFLIFPLIFACFCYELIHSTKGKKL